MPNFAAKLVSFLDGIRPRRLQSEAQLRGTRNIDGGVRQSPSRTIRVYVSNPQARTFLSEFVRVTKHVRPDTSAKHKAHRGRQVGERKSQAVHAIDDAKVRPDVLLKMHKQNNEPQTNAK